MASRSAHTAARLALAALVMSALLHAWLHASVRPLYQVSDEISYLSALQQEIYGVDRAGTVAYRCAAPPEGLPLFIDPGGKRGFRHSGAWLLRRLCEAGVPSQTAYWVLRLASGLSMPLIVVCTAWLVRTIWPDSLAWATGAAAVVALQPLVATFAGGVTPDAFANAWSSATLLLATRHAAGHGGWATAAAMTAGAIVAAAWKDTTLFLIPTVAVAFLLGRVSHAAAHPDRTWWRLGGSVATALAVLALIPSVLKRLVLPTMSLDIRFGAVAMADPLALATTTVSTLASQVPQLAWSAWMPLGNFGASALTMPDAFAWLGVASIVGVGGGAGRLMVDRGADPTTRRVVALWLIAIGLCALQPALRQTVDARPDLFQGRWLFPVLTPCAALATWWLRGRGRRWLPLTVLAAATVAGVALVRVVGHYYLDFPSTYDWANLFLRSSSNVPLDDATVRLWMQRPQPLQQGTWFIAGFALWATSTVIAAVASARLCALQEPVCPTR